MKLIDVLSYGPIVYPTFGGAKEIKKAGLGSCFVTVNGAYMNFWSADDRPGPDPDEVNFHISERRAYDKDLSKITVEKVTRDAKKFFEDLTVSWLKR